MFGKIIEIKDNTVIIENSSGETEANILNLHVVFTSSNDLKTVGEIIAMTKSTITITLIGEIVNDKFIAGVIKKPSLKSGCRLVYKSEVELFLGNQDIASNKTLYIGKSAIYDGFKITASAEQFLGGHFAIIGNTGSGKSCGAARILQNIFYHIDDALPINAHIAVFDVYGEYNNAFSKFNSIPGIGFRYYSTEINENKNDIIIIPPFLLEADDWALLLNADDPSQIQIIEKALSLVNIFKGEGEKAIAWKNSIISNSLLDILTSGNNNTQIRDQIIAVLSKYNTPNINLNTPIIQPGYTRTLRQCLNIDNQGKIANIQLVVELLEKYINIDIEPMPKNEILTYSLEDLYYALEFALISEGILISDKIFDRNNILKIRLYSIINSNTSNFFNYPNYISKKDFVQSLFKTSSLSNAQLINFNFNNIDERLARVFTKIYCKMFFNYATKLEEKTSYPIHIILEEAHRFVQDNNDINVIGYNIFDRITKEGRKYGVILGLITQRPSELSKTALSQCSNFIVFRMYHPEDLNIIKEITSNIAEESVIKIKDSQPGSAMVFGTAFPIPALTKFELPDPIPISQSLNVVKTWYIK